MCGSLCTVCPLSCPCPSVGFRLNKDHMRLMFTQVSCHSKTKQRRPTVKKKTPSHTHTQRYTHRYTHIPTHHLTIQLPFDTEVNTHAQKHVHTAQHSHTHTHTHVHLCPFTRAEQNTHVASSCAPLAGSGSRTRGSSVFTPPSPPCSGMTSSSSSPSP